MTIASAGWFLEVELVDNGANTTRRTYDLVSADAAAAATDSAAVLAALDGVTDAPIKQYHFYEKMVEALLVLPASGVEIENQALLDFDIVGHPEKTATLTIPAPSPSDFQTTTGAGANIVNTSNAAIIAYRDLFRTGGKCTISDGEVASSLIKGRRIHRKSDRG